jgi:hypothetical protein
MTFSHSQSRIFRKLIGLGLIALALLGATSLSTKEVPLALFGERSTGVVKKVEVIQTSTKTKWEKKGFGPKKAISRGSDSTFMHLGFKTKDGLPVEVKTLATFNTEARVGDEHPLIYLPSNPEKAKIYSAKQLWLPMCVGFTFSGLCLMIGLFLIRPSPVSVEIASR